MNVKAAIATLIAVPFPGALPLGLLVLGGVLWWQRHNRAARLAEQLRRIMPRASDADVDDFAGPLAAAMARFNVNTPARQAAFLAQLAHESDELWHQRDRYGSERGEEYASGLAYEGRRDLGNTEPGDGQRFKGRGLIQVTGRANYAKAAEALGPNFLERPELLNEPKHSANAAGHFWESHGLNELADAGDFGRITRIINGGTNGQAQRESFLARAGEALAATGTESAS
jgi:putative chitinase